MDDIDGPLKKIEKSNPFVEEDVCVAGSRERTFVQASSKTAEGIQDPTPKLPLLERLKQGLSSLSGSLWSVLKIVTLLFVFFGLALLLFPKSDGDVILVEPFAVPGSLESKGYSPQVISHRIIDQIRYIENTANTQMKQRQFLAAVPPSMPDVEVPELHVSAKSMVLFFRDLSGKYPAIGGEVVTRDRNVQVTVRFLHDKSGQDMSETESIEGSLTNLNSLLLATAEKITRRTEPYVLASYYYSQGKQEESLRTIAYCPSGVTQNRPMRVT